jgi:hypothetical protein
LNDARKLSVKASLLAFKVSHRGSEFRSKDFDLRDFALRCLNNGLNVSIAIYICLMVCRCRTTEGTVRRPDDVEKSPALFYCTKPLYVR